MPKELFSLSRSQIKEVRIFAEWAVLSEGKLISQSWDDEPGVTPPLIIARSLLKPFQALASRFAFEQDFEVIGLSSHSGEKMHEEALWRLQQKAGVPWESLIVKPCYPMDSLRAEYLKRADVSPAAVYHPCCGKHLLYAASHTRPDLPYASQQSPTHEALCALIERYIGHRGQWVSDSCGLPTLVAAAPDHLRLWAALAQDGDARVQRMLSLWQQNPVLTGGSQRLDSQIMNVSGSHFLAKEGADGLLMVQSMPRQEKASLSILIKLAAGYNAAHLSLGLAALVEKISYKSPAWDKLKGYLLQKKSTLVPSDQSFAGGDGLQT